MTRSRSRSLCLALPLLCACTELGERPPAAFELEPDAHEPNEPLSLVSLELGVVTGGIYNSGAEPLSSHGGEVMCEMKQSLGAEWIRIESDWWDDTSPELYQDIVREASAAGLRTLVIVPAQLCVQDPAPAQIDAFTADYVDHLQTLANEVFVGDAAVAAFEITNEPNVQCDNGASRIDGNAMAWLLYRVWQWREQWRAENPGRDVLLVSGGTLNSYQNGEWPAAFWGSGMWDEAEQPPFDYVGVHPYNPFSYGPVDAPDFDEWRQTTTAQLKEIGSRVDDIFGLGSGTTRLFVTEFGWDRKPHGAKVEDCPNCVGSPDAVAEGFHAALDAFVDSGRVDVALWYTYRDHEGIRMGLRGAWDGTQHPIQPMWHDFADVAGGDGIPEGCWGDGDGDEPAEPGGGGAPAAGTEVLWLIRHAAQGGDPELVLEYGRASDRLLVGDWNGDGRDQPGVFRDGQWYLDGVAPFAFGEAGDVPVVGDWDGDGIDTIGLFRGGTWHLRDGHGDGTVQSFGYGLPGDVPVVGDWNGDGIDTVGVRREWTFYLRNSNTTGIGDLEVPFGDPGDVPVVGDWNGNGIDTVGVYRSGRWFLRLSNEPGPADLELAYGAWDDRPVAGDFDGDGRTGLAVAGTP